MNKSDKTNRNITFLQFIFFNCSELFFNLGHRQDKKKSFVEKKGRFFLEKFLSFLFLFLKTIL